MASPVETAAESQPPSRIGSRLRHIRARVSVTRRVLILVLAGSLVLACAAAAVLEFVWVHPAQQHDQDRTAALGAARTLTEQILSYTPQTVSQDLARAREGVSGSFAGQFASIESSVIGPAVAQGLSTKATVSHAGVIRSARGQVVALVFVDQRSARVGEAPQSTPARLEVTLNQVAGRWLISDMRTL